MQLANSMRCPEYFYSVEYAVLQYNARLSELQCNICMLCSFYLSQSSSATSESWKESSCALLLHYDQNFRILSKYYAQNPYSTPVLIMLSIIGQFFHQGAFTNYFCTMTRISEYYPNIKLTSTVSTRTDPSSMNFQTYQ